MAASHSIGIMADNVAPYDATAVYVKHLNGTVTMVPGCEGTMTIGELRAQAAASVGIVVSRACVRACDGCRFAVAERFACVPPLQWHGRLNPSFLFSLTFCDAADLRRSWRESSGPVSR